jgi:transposase-like protein
MDAKKMVTLSNMKCNWHKNRIKYSELEKMRFVMEGIQSDQSISEYCKGKGINSDFFFKWKKDISQVTVRKAADLKNRSAENEIIQIESENFYLKKLIDQLETENKLLKKRLEERKSIDPKLQLN